MSQTLGLKNKKFTAQLKEADRRIKLARKGDYLALLKFLDNESVSDEAKYSAVLELVKLTNSRQVGFRGLEYLRDSINSKYSGDERIVRMRSMLGEVASQHLNSPLLRKAAQAELERIK
jgi:hypothetical protein